MGHWYTQDGQLIECDLRQARKDNLLPSVTAITGMFDKPGLNEWRINNALYALLTMPALDEWKNGKRNYDELIKMAKEDAEKVSLTSRDLGTEIHFAIRQHLVGAGHAVSAEAANIMDRSGVMEWLDLNCGEKHLSEFSGANLESGYGGTIDWYGRESRTLIDFKTSNVRSKPFYGDEYLMQLAAYEWILQVQGYEVSTIKSVIISTNADNIGIWEREWSLTELLRGLGIFEHLLEAWRLQKKYPFKRIS